MSSYLDYIGSIDLFGRSKAANKAITESPFPLQTDEDIFDFDLPRKPEMSKPKEKTKIEPPSDLNSENDNSEVKLISVLESLQLQVNNLQTQLNDKLGKTADEDKIYGDSFDRIPLPNFKDRTFFSLLDPYNAKTIDMIYNPRVKFSGEGNTRVSDFLTSLTDSHDHCPVDEYDFLSILISKLQGRPMDLVNSWKKSQYSIEEIYRSLFETFTNQITTTEAREKLTSYLFPREFRIAQVVSELTMLTDYAVQGGVNAEQAKLMQSVFFQDALQRSLPLSAYKICLARINSKRRELNREPAVSDMVIAILARSSEIDLELSSAKGHRFSGDRKVFSILNKPNRVVHKDNKRPYISELSSQGSKSAQNYRNKNENRRPFSNNKTNNSKFSPRSKFIKNTRPLKYSPLTKVPDTKNPNVFARGRKFNLKNKTGDKTYNFKVPKTNKCSFCGSLGHTASNGCWSIVDDAFKLYEGPISQQECQTCKDKLKMNLYHMQKMCPLRDHLLKAYKQGLISPRGIFRKYVSENNI